MNIYVLMGFIWIIGWLYACGVHQGSKSTVMRLGEERDKKDLNKGGLWQYVVLFFGWPHYLGYNK